MNLTYEKTSKLFEYRYYNAFIFSHVSKYEGVSKETIWHLCYLNQSKDCTYYKQTNFHLYFEQIKRIIT